MTITSGTMNAQASISSSEFYPAEVRFEANVEHIISEDATKPDPAWEHTDSHGHFHAWAQDDKTPTLERYSVHVDCDGSCGGVCEGEGYDETHWKCAICGDEVEPRFVPDEEARTAGIPVVTSKQATVTVHGTGPLPPIGQDNGDGMMTLAGSASAVSIRVRTDAGEMIGRGHADLRMTYRAGRAEWTVTIGGAWLLPRLGQPDHAEVT